VKRRDSRKKQVDAWKAYLASGQCSGRKKLNVLAKDACHVTREVVGYFLKWAKESNVVERRWRRSISLCLCKETRKFSGFIPLTAMYCLLVLLMSFMKQGRFVAGLYCGHLPVKRSCFFSRQK
jgi:hypothetical protein